MTNSTPSNYNKFVFANIFLWTCFYKIPKIFHLTLRIIFPSFLLAYFRPQMTLLSSQLDLSAPFHQGPVSNDIAMLPAALLSLSVLFAIMVLLSVRITPLSKHDS